MPFVSTEITSFIGPAENPLSDGGKWAQYYTRYPLRRSSGNAYPTVSYPVNGMYYTAKTFRATCEAYLCTGGGGLGAALESWRIAFYLGDPNNMVGYSSGYGGGIGKYYFFRKYTGGGGYFGIGSGQPHNNPPHKLGIRITATRVEQWADCGSGWELIQWEDDASYRGVFYAAIECEEQGGINEVWIACFGGKTKKHTQIYRYVRF